MPTLPLTEAGQGSPLVLIHAFPLDRGMWQAQVDAFADRYRVLTPDVFGFGTSPLREEGWTMESMADALAETLDERGIRDGVILGGLSMGGYISLAFAKRYPERLRGLILADTRADADTAEMKTTRNETIEFVKGSSAAALIEKQLPKMLGPETLAHRPGVVARVRQLAAKQTVPAVVAALQALRDRPDSTESLKEFEFPTLVIVGAEDAITPPALADAMMRELTHGTLATIPNAGHLSNLEQPGAFGEVVRSWLETAAPTQATAPAAPVLGGAAGGR